MNGRLKCIVSLSVEVNIIICQFYICLKETNYEKSSIKSRSNCFSQHCELHLSMRTGEPGATFRHPDVTDIEVSGRSSPANKIS